ncbi:CcmD family protein [Thermincola ferriacetica]
MAYLTVAYTIIWLLISVFVFASGRKLTRLEGEVGKLESLAKRQMGRE